MQDYIPFFQAEKRSIAEKLAKYFNYSGIDTKIYFDEEKDSYILSVPSDKEKEAKKHYQAFYFVERDTSLDNMYSQTEQEEIASSIEEGADTDKTLASEDTSDDIRSNELQTDDVDEDSSDDISLETDDDLEAYETEVADNAIEADEIDNASEDNLEDSLDEEKSAIKSLLSDSGSYVMKSEKYKDYVSTQYVFILLGIAGIIFVILNLMEILTLLNGLYPNIIMGALFLFFIYIGISTGRKAKELKLDIDEETKLTDKINEWLHNTVTEEFLTSISNTKLSEELDYINKSNTIRDMLIIEFGDQDPSYLDRLIEEFYSKSFD